MIEQKQQKNQLPKEIQSAFTQLKVLQHLKTVGFKKRFGFSYSYLFQLVFVLLFHHKNWFRMLESDRGESFPGKDAVYRFLNHAGHPWRRFLTLLSTTTLEKVRPLTSTRRVTAFIVDDSMFERNRSKAVELLGRFKDHATGCYYKGYRMLTLGWSDGHTFIPVDFSLLSSLKSQINGITEGMDKRTSGYKRRIEALRPAPQLIPEMLDRAMDAGVTASYVLMDSWFTHAPLVKEIVERGLHAVGMVKADNKRYQVGVQRLSLQELYYAAAPVKRRNKGVLRSIRATLAGIPITMVFVRHRSKKKEWLAILCTDLSLTEEEIIQTYGIRWDIEVFFKCAKSLLRLQKEFQGRSYDLLISHTTIVFSRYIVLAWQHRQSTDERSLGGLFLALCDEVSELDWAIALHQLFELITDIAKKTSKKLSKFVTT
ncbi:transposase [Aneurinibacillus sp. Ricciae_BoGa-3]|nr:transposase [Aneurinibacillus sp. Ricciae_BoGa-3]WCK54251.1 transposase [Aneurinibacillus sp. Ricciae_BoGa-3]